MTRPTAAAVLLLLLASASAAPAQSPAPSILLSNAENLELYYLVDPPGLTGPDTTSAVFLGKVVSFLSETTPEATFKLLPPLGVERIEGLPEGTHVLVGVFVPRGAAELPVRVLRLQAGGGIAERLYTVYREPATATVKANLGRVAALVGTAQQGAATDAAGEGTAQSAAGGGGPTVGAGALTTFWRSLEPVVTFTGAFEPEIVIRQSRQGSTIIPFARASFWGVDGVRLRELRLARRTDELAFRVQTFGSMSAKESLLFYIQESRSSGTDNRLTLELTPVEGLGGGYVLLWRKGVAKPVIVGRFAQQDNVVVGRVLYVDAAPYVDLDRAPPDLTLDICTAHHEPDRGVYEEFYHATVRMDQLPRSRDESPLFL